MSKPEPKRAEPRRRNVPLRILVWLLVWILCPIACFALGMGIIGPRFVKETPPRPVQQDPDDASAPRHASDWLNGEQLPTRLGPTGTEYPRVARSRHRPASSKHPKPGDGKLDQIPPDQVQPGDQPTDKTDGQPTDQSGDQPSDQPKGKSPDGSSDPPSDVQKPDGIN